MAETPGPLVDGHALLNGGAPFNDRGHAVVARIGRGKCECGDLSPVTGTKSDRVRWHRDHKREAVR